MNADLGVMCIMGLPATPSMPNHGDLLARRTNANHLARLAFGAIPCDKYNHCGGEGCFPDHRANVVRLAAFAPY
jgi:hypothetical protein